MKLRYLLIAMLGVFLFSSNPLNAQDFKYVGAKKCKMCHAKKGKAEEYTIWESKKHSKAYVTLGTDEAKAIAEANGIEDAQKEKSCLACHATANTKFKRGVTYEEGVSCESCHGPAEKYVMKHKMLAKKGDFDALRELGFLKFTGEDKAEKTKELCMTCHSQEKRAEVKGHTAEEFIFEERLNDIKHWKCEDEK